MNYIWYKYNQKYKYITADPRDVFSPYVEDCLLADKLPYRKVNPNLRFGKIFNCFIKAEQDMNLPPAERQAIENCIYHYLAQLDRKTGIDRQAVEEYILAKEIEGGCYGKGTTQDFALLNHEHRRVLLRFLRKHQQDKGLNSYFCQAVQGAFAGAAAYYYPDDNKFLVYIPQAEDEEAGACMRLLEFFLLGLGAGLRIFWAYHFGIIGKNNTMSIGSIEIY